MLSLISFCWTFIFTVCAYLQNSEVIASAGDYTGSTPADAEVVRTFLGIRLTDSVDFIRWKLHFNSTDFELRCNYGIGKPNTNGFYDGGRTVDLKGKVNMAAQFLALQFQNKTLYLAQLNNDLLQVSDNKKKFLVGTGGWSYTLNTVLPQHSRKVNFKAKEVTNVKDSLVFVGRTPCGVPGIIEPGRLCYKLKWKIIFYPVSPNFGSGKCRILSTAHRESGGMLGSWRIVDAKDGALIYEIYDDHDKPYLSLMKLDEHILVFTDRDNKLLVGDQDFSYTMNRVY